MPQKSSKRILTVKDVMQELGLGRSKVYELINREGLPTMRFGRAIRILASSFDQWLAEREQKSA